MTLLHKIHFLFFIKYYEGRAEGGLLFEVDGPEADSELPVLVDRAGC